MDTIGTTSFRERVKFMGYFEVRHHSDKILGAREMLNLEPITKRPLQTHGAEDGWVEATPVGKCITVLLVGHVRTKG